MADSFESWHTNDTIDHKDLFTLAELPDVSLTTGKKLPGSGKPKGQELDPAGAFTAWKAKKNPQTTQALLDAAAPSIAKAVHYYTKATDPVALSYGRRLAIESLDRYDPKMASLATFINRQLQPLQRWQASRSKGVKVPDRMVADSARLKRMETELSDELGREPSAEELADRVGISLPKLIKLRYATPSIMASSTVVGESDDGEDTTAGDSVVSRDTSKEWAMFIRHDLHDRDKVIMDHTLGLNGAPILPNKMLAAKLKITPAAVTQRKAKIQAILDRQSELSPFG